MNDQTYEEQQRDGINGCGSYIAYPYFVRFTLVVSLIFLNLFVAIILEGQLQATQQQEARVGEDSRLAFQKAWTKYDPDATGFISVDNLAELTLDLAQEEYLLRKKPEFKTKKYVMFNFTKRIEVKVHMKLKRDLNLNADEKLAKQNERILKNLDWQF